MAAADIPGPGVIRLDMSSGSNDTRPFVVREEALYNALLQNMYVDDYDDSTYSNGKATAVMSDVDIAIRIARLEAEAAARIDTDRSRAESLPDTRRHAGIWSTEDILIGENLENLVYADLEVRPDSSVNSEGVHQKRNGHRRWRMRHYSPPPDHSELYFTLEPIESVNYASMFRHSGQNSFYGGSSRLEDQETSPRKRNIQTPVHVCIACQEPIGGIAVKVPCDHHYDHSCILDLFSTCMRDESLFPPRCCDEVIPHKLVEPLMSAETYALFTGKMREFSISNRVYCSNPNCSHFLGPQKTSIPPQLLRCPKDGCGHTTCAQCKSHVPSNMNPSRHRCQKDQGDKAVLRLGKRAGWARCPGCFQLIELNSGCNHMTCRCKTEFCYVCQSRWKTCNCSSGVDHGVIRPALRRIVRFRPLRGTRWPWRFRARETVNVDMENDRGLLWAMFGFPGQDHDEEFRCAHLDWGLQMGLRRTRCEHCSHKARLYLWRCRTCRMLACSRCRRSHL